MRSSKRTTTQGASTFFANNHAAPWPTFGRKLNRDPIVQLRVRVAFFIVDVDDCPRIVVVDLWVIKLFDSFVMQYAPGPEIISVSAPAEHEMLLFA
jgi:hypothetical protein